MMKGVKAMDINNILIGQENNRYHLYLPTRIYLGNLLMPPDGAYLYDSRALEFITKGLALRWQVYPNKENQNKHRN